MNKRESGWYRIYINECDLWDIFYFDGVNWWYGESVITETTIADCDFDVYEMVMTPEGDLVYHQPTDRALAAVERYKNPESWNVNEHDPLYNTQQEG